MGHCGGLQPMSSVRDLLSFGRSHGYCIIRHYCRNGVWKSCLFDGSQAPLVEALSDSVHVEL